FLLSASADGYPSTGIAVGTLVAHETKNVGVLSLQHGGTLRITVRSETGGAPEGLEAYCSAKDGSGRAGLHCENGTVSSGTIAPGDYQVGLKAAGCAPAVRAITIRTGETTTLDVKLEAGVAVNLRVHPSEEMKQRIAAASIMVQVRIADAQGNTIDLKGARG